VTLGTNSNQKSILFSRNRKRWSA